MVNNSTNIKNNNHRSPQIIEHKMSITYRDRHNYMVGVKPIMGSTPHITIMGYPMAMQI
jgi:hypothetical protein